MLCRGVELMIDAFLGDLAFGEHFLKLLVDLMSLLLIMLYFLLPNGEGGATIKESNLLVLQNPDASK